MEQITINLRPGKEYLELGEFLTISNLAQTGGQAKQAIQSGLVKLNGEIETRKRKKLISGDLIEFDNKQYKVIIK